MVTVPVPIPAQVALGKLPKRSDPRTLSLPKLLTGEITPDPEIRNETAVTGHWGELGNNSLGDCAIAAAAHAEMLWAAKHGRTLPDPTLTQVLDAYSKITGYQEGHPDTDKGADLLSVLKYWQQKGIAGQTIGAFAEVLPRDVQTLKWTIATLDLAYVGLQLPAAVIYTGYRGDDSFTCVSWGRIITVPMAFHKAYCDEAYAIIAPDRLDGRTETPSQLDTKALQETLGLVQNWPSPD